MPFYDPIRIGASSAADTAYTVDRSLRFNGEGTHHYLERTPSSTGNRQICTFSCWTKRSNIGVNHCLASAYSANNNNDNISIILRSLSSGDCSLRVVGYFHNFRITNAAYRDPSAWLHVVVAIDTTQSSADDRIKIYINGVQETSFSTSGNVTQSMNIAFNDTSVHRIGTQSNSLSNTADGYIAEVNFIDGFQYDASYFGETDAITGQWNPKKYTGSYGTNGYYLNFSDNSGTTATTLGKDSSGNGNNFTPNNFVTGDAVKDTPTNNFATLKMLGTPFSSGASISEGNLKLVTGSSGGGRNQNRQAFAPMLVNSGKWYAEFVGTASDNANFIGVGPYEVMTSPTANNTRYAYVYSDGDSYLNTNGSESIATYGGGIPVNNVVGVYLDMDTSPPVVYFSSNGQWADGSGNFDESSPTAGLTLGNSFFTTNTGGNDGFATFLISSAGGSYNMTIHANFGQDSTFAGLKTAGGNTDANGIGDFAYAVPTGAKALCSANLPDPTILLPNKHFGTITYSGNSSTQVITDTDEVDFTPDWVWVKRRNGTNSHILTDAVRGVHKYLVSSQNIAEGNNAIYLTAFNNGGFTSGNNGDMNVSGRTYVAWNWNAGDSDGVTYKVVVVSDSGNKYRFRNSADSATFAVSAVQLNLAEGGTYVFDWSDSSAQGHPIRFSTTADGTHGGGSEYTTGVVKDDSAYKTTITVAASAPTLYYYCQNHSGMGSSINTNSTLGSSNFDGDVTPADEVPVVKANTTAGFSIISYTGQSGTYKVGHGLGVAPELIITKNRASTNSWWTYTTAVDGSLDWGGLNLTQGFQAADGYGISLPTSTTFGDDDDFTANNGTAICYCFNSVAGYSKVGTYRGNGNADGTFVFTGFRPAWIMTKRTDGGSQNWLIHDIKRDPHNVANKKLAPNLNYEENNSSYIGSSSQDTIDILSNGFKMRSNNNHTNISGGTFIYLAFAEAPFKNARAR